MNQRRIHIKNLGRISEADIRLGGFTVLVGKNSTGKSFASKAIYSFLRAISNMPPLYSQVKFLQSRLLRAASIIEDEAKAPLLENKQSIIPSNLRERIEELFDLEQIADNSASAFIEQSALIEYFEKKKESIVNLQESIDDMLSRKEIFVDSPEDHEQADFEEDKIQRWLIHVKDFLNELLELSTFSQGYVVSNMRVSLISNFQVSHRREIFREHDAKITIELENMVNFAWDSGNESSVEFDSADKLEGFSSSLPNAFLIESPVHWKMKTAIDVLSRSSTARRAFAYRSQRGLSKKTLIPGYCLDLLNGLAEPLFVDENQEKFEKISNDISETIGGKLRITENDDIVFRSSADGKEHSLPLAATGIASFGMLGLLLSQGLLQKGAYLFIDEPEAHLHPEWVVRMADALLALVENGVNVVVATHSSVFLKWIEVTTAENSDLVEKFAINHFVDGKVVQDDALDFDAKLNAVQVDISKPYGRLYMRGLGL